LEEQIRHFSYFIFIFSLGRVSECILFEGGEPEPLHHGAAQPAL